MEYIRLSIKYLDEEGRGRGQHTDQGGHTYNVAARGAFVGDEVLVQIERTFKTHQLKVGKVLKFFQKGDCHIERICHHKGPCPACPLHGLKESLALDLKKTRIVDALKQKGLSFLVDDVIPHKNSFGYRQKVKLVAQILNNKLRLGIYVPYTHRFEIAEQCPYVHPEINAAIKKTLYALNHEASSTELRVIKNIIIRMGKGGPSAVIVSSEALSDSIIRILNHSIKEGWLYSASERIQTEKTNSLFAGFVHRNLGPEMIEPLEGGPAVDPDSFCQTDPDQALTMYTLVADYLSSSSIAGIFIDGYAGVGGFSRALQQKGCSHIIAIEQSDKALPTLNQLGVKVLLMPMAEAVAQISSLTPITGIVVDPPKKGLGQDASDIARLGASRLALISCEPEAMARDLEILIENGYRVERILPIDFFAGTPNIETVVLMQKQ